MQGTQGKKWYEDESFWKTFAPKLFSEKILDAATEEIDHIVKLLDIENSGCTDLRPYLVGCLQAVPPGGVGMYLVLCYLLWRHRVLELVLAATGATLA